MHVTSINKLITENKSQALGTMLIDAINMIKNSNHDLYVELDKRAYECAYGDHINDALLDNLYGCHMSQHWTKEQTTNVAKTIGFSFDTYNECDFNYAMNYLYSTLYATININDANSWAKMAKHWLENNNPLKHFYYVKSL